MSECRRAPFPQSANSATCTRKIREESRQGASILSTKTLSIIVVREGIPMQSSIWKIITAIGIAGVGTLVVLEVQHRLTPAGHAVNQPDPPPGTAELTSETTVTPNAETDFDRLMSGSESNAQDFVFTEPPADEPTSLAAMPAAATSGSPEMPDPAVINTKVNRQNLIGGENPFQDDPSRTVEAARSPEQPAGAIPADATSVRPVSFVPGAAQPVSSQPQSFDTASEDSLFTSGEPNAAAPSKSFGSSESLELSEPSQSPGAADPLPFSADEDSPRLPLPEPAVDAPDAAPFGGPGDGAPGQATEDEAPPFEIPAISAPSPATVPLKTPPARKSPPVEKKPPAEEKPPAENSSPILFFGEGDGASSPAEPAKQRPANNSARQNPPRSNAPGEGQPNTTVPFDSESSLPAFDATEPGISQQEDAGGQRPRENPPFDSEDSNSASPDTDEVLQPSPVTRFPKPRGGTEVRDDRFDSDNRSDSDTEPDLSADEPSPARIPRLTPAGPSGASDDNSESDEFPPTPGDMFPLDDQDTPGRRNGRAEDPADPVPGRGGSRDRIPRRIEDPLTEDSAPRLLPAVDEDRRSTPDLGRRDSSASSDVIHPHLTVRKKAPPTASVGVPLEYEIFVSNDGQSSAFDVIIEDELPQDVTLEKTQPKADFDRTTRKIIWQFDEIPPGESRHLTVRVIPTGEGTLDGVATVRFKTQVKGSTVITAPRLELDLTGPTEVRVGDEVPFRYLIRNTGTGEAKDVILRSVLPAELRHTEGNDLEYDIKSLGSGEEREIVLTVIAAKEGKHTNRAEITSSGVATASAESEVQVVGAQLKLERLGPERRYVGRTAKFQNIITNDTNFEATDARVLEFVPEGMKFSSAPDGQYNPEDRTITWRIDRIDPGKQVVLDVELTAETAGSFDAVVEVVENAGFRSQGTKTIAVEDLHNVSADISHIEGPVAVGEKIKFAITIDNRGTATANEVQLQVQVPAQITILAAGNKEQGVKARKGPGNSVVYNPVVRIEPNQKQTFQLILQGQEPVRNGMVVAQLKYAEMQEPLVVSESVTVYAD